MPSITRHTTVVDREAEPAAAAEPYAAAATPGAALDGLDLPLIESRFPAAPIEEGEPLHERRNVVPSSAADALWMIFCENGVWFSSASAPEQLTKPLETNESSEGWDVKRVYFLPNSDSYIVIHGAGATALPPPASLGALQVQQVPEDVMAAVENLVSSGDELQTLSWVGDGVWAMFGEHGYAMGANIPATLDAKLAELAQRAHENIEEHEHVAEAPAMVVFAPSAEWLLCVALERGEVDYVASENFPADILAAARALPARDNVTKIEFVPGGGWVMITEAQTVIYGGSGPVLDEISEAVAKIEAEGNVVIDCAALWLNEPIYNMGPFQQPPPVGSTNFDVVQGAGGGAMQTVVHSIEPSGLASITTKLRTSNFWHGFHGSAFVLPLDYTGQPMYEAQFSARWGNEKSEGEVERYWIAHLAASTLKVMRGVLIHHMYSPNSIADDLANLESGIASALGAFTPSIQAVGSLFGGGKGGSSSGKAPSSG